MLCHMSCRLRPLDKDMMGVVNGAAKTTSWEIGVTFQGWLQHLFVFFSAI